MKFAPVFNWKILLVLIALVIVTGSLVYSRYLSLKLGKIETQRVETWVEAQRTIANATDETNLNLAVKISSENKDIPIIETTVKDSITGNYLNLDSASAVDNPAYLKDKLRAFKNMHAPIVLTFDQDTSASLHYYYGESRLQRELRYFPVIQLCIVGLFIIVLIVIQRVANKSAQNRLWVGMAKETAHQLGTPLTSLEGWSEILKSNYEQLERPTVYSPADLKRQEADKANTDQNNHLQILREMGTDIARLKLISDRFAKIGSAPKLLPADVASQVENMVHYIKKRAGGGVQFTFTADQPPYQAMISGPLMDWVIENLLKNALDAISGTGSIQVSLHKNERQILIDIQDSGKGIPHSQFKKVFNPGFTTKKRGWGLGLALTKRIVEQYHHGSIFVRQSEPGKGTTFRIQLPIASNISEDQV